MSALPPEPAVRVEARRLRAAGFALCRVPAGKGAVVRGWTTRSAEPAEFLPTDNIGIQGGPLSHGNRPGHAAVILDLDAAVALAGADAHLPATAMADGRPGKPRSHLVYLVPLDTIPPWAGSTADQGAAAAVAVAGHPGPFLKSFRHRETGVEAIRFLGTGGQATFPPSVWVSPDGDRTERREWVGGTPGEPAVVPFPVLWQAVCELAAACGCAIPEFLPKPPPAARPSSSQAGDVRGRASKYLARMEPSVSGQGGHAKLFAAARALVYGFDLGLEESLDLLLAEFNPRCVPPWSEADVRHKVGDADRCPSDRRRGWIRDADRTDRMTPSRNPGQTQPRPAPPPSGPPPSEPAARTEPGERPDVMLSDVGNAWEFVADHGADVRYVDVWGSWLLWDGRRWRRDDTRAVEEMARRTARRMYREAADGHAEAVRQAERVGDGDGADRAKVAVKVAEARVAHARKSHDARALARMLGQARSWPGVRLTTDVFDAHPWLLNCPNGTLDLRTAALRPHDRADYLTKLCPTPYDPCAACPTWAVFLDAVFAADAEVVAFARRLFGYGLTGDVSEHVLPVFWGSGSNGKSTLLETVMEVMGEEYAMKAPQNMLMARTHEPHPTERADLHGMRLVCAVETDDGKKLSESLIKELTGGDKVRARRMRQDFFQFAPTHKLVLCTNHKPAVRGTDEGIWRRLRLLAFVVRFWNPDKPADPTEARPDHLRADKGMKDKLRAEAAGILAWLARGCVEWQRDGGLGLPDAVASATTSYREEEDVLSQFLTERCDRHRSFRVRASSLYAAYVSWCESNRDRDVMTQKAFSTAIASTFEKTTSNGVWYIGLSIKESNSDERKDTEGIPE